MTTMVSIENWLSYKSLSWSMDYQPLSIVYYKKGPDEAKYGTSIFLPVSHICQSK